MSETTITPEQTKALQAWDKAAKAADYAKSEEMRLRKEAAEICFPTSKTGTNTLVLGAGYTAKMVKKETFKFVIPEGAPEDAKMADAMTELAERMRKVSPNEGPFIFERLCKISYEPSVTEYKTLSPEMKAVVDVFIETKFGSPTLEIKEPPAKAKAS